MNVTMDSEDLLIIFASHSATDVIAHVWSTKGNGLWHYVGGLKTAVPMTQFLLARVVSSAITVFSDTISTTNSNLSGRMTTVSLQSLPKQQIAFAELPSYAPL